MPRHASFLVVASPGSLKAAISRSNERWIYHVSFTLHLEPVPVHLWPSLPPPFEVTRVDLLPCLQVALLNGIIPPFVCLFYDHFRFTRGPLR